MAISRIKPVMRLGMKPIYEKEYNTTIKEISSNIGNFFYTIKKQGLKAVGPVIVTYKDEVNDLSKKTKHLVAVLVNKQTDVTKSYKPHEALKIKVKGSYKQLPLAYDKMIKHIERKKYILAGKPYEVYVSGPKLGFLMIGLETDIYFPIKKR